MMYNVNNVPIYNVRNLTSNEIHLNEIDCNVGLTPFREAQKSGSRTVHVRQKSRAWVILVLYVRYTCLKLVFYVCLKVITLSKK